MKLAHLNAPLVRLPPKSNIDLLLATGSRVALVTIGVLALVAALDYGRFVLAPVSLAVVIGLMFGPLADRIERFGIPPTLSAIAVVVAFIVILSTALIGLALPLSTWLERLPDIWLRLRSGIAEWQGLFSYMASLQDTLREATGQSKSMTVTVEGGSAMQSAAFLAPAIIGQVIIFLASLYFFIATRDQIRLSVLALCFSRRLRWRVARVFKDVEQLVSRYLLAITAINAGLGVAVALAMWLIGMPSPILWGVMAGILNYVVYVGPAIMAVVLLGVGLATSGDFIGVILPPAVYLSINMIEAQFVTPHVIGRSVTLNPFIVFLSITGWLWLWGPVGGLIAVPSLLIAYAVIRNTVPLRA